MVYTVWVGDGQVVYCLWLALCSIKFTLLLHMRFLLLAAGVHARRDDQHIQSSNKSMQVLALVCCC